MSRLRMIAAAVLAVGLGAAGGRAAPPPTVYLPEKKPAAYVEMQKKAPEGLTIKVLSSTVRQRKGTSPHPVDGRVTFNGRERVVKVRSAVAEVEVRAEVTAVTRSVSGLKKGDKIKIVYTRREPVFVEGIEAMEGIRWRFWSAPPEPPVLQKDKQMPAYLIKQKDGTYALAAEGLSFKTASPQK